MLVELAHLAIILIKFYGQTKSVAIVTKVF